MIVPEAVARRGPMEESQSAFTAHDGTEMMVLCGTGDWLQVTDAARHIGWVRQKTWPRCPERFSANVPAHDESRPASHPTS